jgi:hypothetical protein
MFIARCTKSYTEGTILQCVRMFKNRPAGTLFCNAINTNFRR